MLVLILVILCLINSFAVAQTRGEDVDVPVLPGLAAEKVQTVELERKEELQTDTSDKDTELEKRGDCSREGRMCEMHNYWGRCVDKFIQDLCPCTCASSTSQDKNKSNSNRNYNRNKGDSNSNSGGNKGNSGSGKSPNDSQSGLGISVEEEILLDEHNKRRRHHGVPDLIYDTKLAASSLSWCRILAREDKFAHSEQENGVEGVGENLYYSWGMSEEDVPKSAVKSWYNEIKDHDFNNPAFKSITGHFTQVIWKKTTRVGCGVTKPSESSSPKRKSYVCCHYSPPGNYQGEFRANVPRPRNGVKYP